MFGSGHPKVAVPGSRIQAEASPRLTEDNMMSKSNPASFSIVIDVAIYGTDPSNPNYVFFPTIARINPNNGRRKHSRSGISFVVNKNSVGPQRISNSPTPVGLDIPDPKVIDFSQPENQNRWRLGYCLEEAMKHCR